MVTFLLTDVEGSSRMWEAEPAVMGEAVRLCERIVERAVAGRGGTVVKSRGEGDSHFCVFDRATDAVAAAAELQGALAAARWPTRTPLRLRVALHTGEAERRDGDWFGPTVNRCARIKALAAGGQILLSATTVTLAGEALPPRCAIADLGSHRLKDLADPERIAELRLPGSPSFPPLRSLDARLHNLPVQATSFVGRGEALADVARLLGEQRLVTLSGPGGVGKTRLSLHVAAEVLPSFPDGAWLVELAPLADAAALDDALAAAVGVVAQPGRALRESMAEVLRGRRLLVVLDNCEHVVDAAAGLAGWLLEALEDVRVLATSREALGLAGEWVFPVAPLAVTGGDGAVELFRERAAAAARDAPLEDTIVAEICARLDGIPLAIELAAARMRSMSATQLRDRLDDRFRLLTGPRAAPDRHQTLRQTVAWSYELLDARERAVLDRASVFVGGFVLDAAVAVCGAGELDELELLDVLDSLTRKSLLQLARGDEPRYGMLETIRQFAAERLAERGEEDVVRRRHAAHYAAAADEVFALFRGPQERRAYEIVDAEIDNLRAAFRWACDRGRTDAAVRIAAGIHEPARFRRRGETFGWAAEVADAARLAQHPKLPLLLTMACDSSWALGRLEEAKRFGQEAIALRDDPRFEPFVWAYSDLAQIAVFEGDVAEALGLIRAGAAHRTDAGDRFCLALLLHFLAVAAPEEARARCDEILEIVRAARVPMSLVVALNAYADALADVDPARALAAAQEALNLSVETGNRFLEAVVRAQIAGHQARTGGPDAALETLGQLVETWRINGDTFLLGSLGHLVVLLARLGRGEAAATLHGAATRDVALDPQVPGLAAAIAAVGDEAGEEAVRSWRARGAAMDTDATARYAQEQIAVALEMMRPDGPTSWPARDRPVMDHR